MPFRVAKNFKVQDGKIVAYDRAGNKIFSRNRPGETADIDEALEYLIDDEAQLEVRRNALEAELRAL